MTSISRSTLLSLATLALMAAGSFGCGGTMGRLTHVSRSVDDTVEVMRGRADAPIAVTANALRLQVDATPQCELAEVQQVEVDLAYKREHTDPDPVYILGANLVLAGVIWAPMAFYYGAPDRGHWLGVETAGALFGVGALLIVMRILEPNMHQSRLATNFWDDAPSNVVRAACPAARAGLQINLLEEITGVMGEALLVALDLASDRGAVDLLPEWRALFPLAQRSATLTAAVSRTDPDARRMLSTRRISPLAEADFTPGDVIEGQEHYAASSGDPLAQSSAWYDESLSAAAEAVENVRIPARDIFHNSGDRIAESLNLALCANDPCNDATHDPTSLACEVSARACADEVTALLGAEYLGLSAVWRQRLVAAMIRAGAVIDRVRAARDAALADREAQRQALAEQQRVFAAAQAQQLALRRAQMEEEAAREGRAEAAAANARAASRAAEQASRLSACLARCPGERSACERVCSRVH